MMKANEARQLYIDNKGNKKQIDDIFDKIKEASIKGNNFIFYSYPSEEARNKLYELGYNIVGDKCWNYAYSFILW